MLGVIEHLFKLDIELQRDEETSFKRAIQTSDDFSNGIETLENLINMPVESINRKAVQILNDYVESKYVSGPETDPVHLLIAD